MATPNGAPDAPSANGDSRLLYDLLVNTTLGLSRAALSRGMGFDPRRDVNDECGYPSGPQSPEWYQDLHDDGFGVAARVNECLPRECWQVQPGVYEDEDADTETDFELAWDALAKDLRAAGEGGEKSWYADEKGSPVWEYLQRVDELSGIGRYGLLLLGFDDVEDDDGLRVPVKPGGSRKLLYLRALPETLCPVARFVTDTRDRRYGKPEAYTVTFHDTRQGTVQGSGFNMATREVHWSRVIHVAEGVTTTDLFGTPRTQPVRNQLLGIQRLYGGAPEMYWKGAFPGYTFSTPPAWGGDVRVNVAAAKDQIENWMNGLQRYLVLNGLQAQGLAPQVVDPTPQVNVLIEAVCIKLGIPVRVFKGSERGELASSQDDAAWNDRLRFRQNYHVTPRIIIPFVDRLIAAGVLPEPKGYHVWWPDLTSQSQAEKADVAVKKTQALSAYVSGGAEAVVPPMDYLTRFLGFDEGEAEAILESAAAHVEEKAELDMQMQEEKIDRGLQAPPGVAGTPPPALPAAAEDVENAADEPVVVNEPDGWEPFDALPLTNETYFATCPRDKQGQCLPSGSADAAGEGDGKGHGKGHGTPDVKTLEKVIP